MTLVPLPDTPCVRVRLDYTEADGFKGGSRLYLSYTGSAPTGATCTDLAGTIAAEWAIHLASLVHETWALTEVDVLDVATDSGLSGQWTGDDAGSSGGDPLPAQVATNVEYDIARRYRGGKPRMFLPPPGNVQQNTPSTWLDAFLTAVNTGVTAFMAAVLPFSEGGTTLADHINLSYYKGFTNITNSSGRERAVPTYRAVALSDVVVGYSAKAQMGSQKRRRAATTY